MIPTGALFQIHLRQGEVQEEGRLPGTEGECVCVFVHVCIACVSGRWDGAQALILVRLVPYH